MAPRNPLVDLVTEAAGTAVGNVLSTFIDRLQSEATPEKPAAAPERKDLLERGVVALEKIAAALTAARPVDRAHARRATGSDWHNDSARFGDS